MILIIRRRASGATFIHPMDPTPRTAILAPGFRQTKQVRAFPYGWNEAAARFKPWSIAGPVEQLRRIASLGLQLRHSVIPFTYDGQIGLSDEDRNLFWNSFGVPVFEQYLGLGNKLLAMECEAHTGLHVAGDFGYLRPDRSSCVCRNPAPRFRRRARIEELADMLA
jgi:hypothetical protein